MSESEESKGRKDNKVGFYNLTNLCVKIFEATQLNFKMMENLSERIAIVSKKLDIHDERTIGE